MLRALTQWLIRKAKHEKEYRLDPALSFSVIFRLLIDRAIMVARGTLSSLFINRCAFPLFKGRQVQIKHGALLRVGACCSFGNGVVLDALSKKGVLIGENVTIPDGTYIRCTGVYSDLGEGLVIGSNTGLGHYNFINAQGGVDIGSNVIIGPNVQILSENHKFDDRKRPIKEQGTTRKGIVIEDDVWIGAGAIILDGVTVGTGAIIAAGAIVSRSVPSFSVAAGCPARVIKERA